MKTGLVLEGGGTRGIYTAGILKRGEAFVIIRNIVMTRDLWGFEAGLRPEIS